MQCGSILIPTVNLHASMPRQNIVVHNNFTVRFQRLSYFVTKKTIEFKMAASLQGLLLVVLVVRQSIVVLVNSTVRQKWAIIFAGIILPVMFLLHNRPSSFNCCSVLSCRLV